MDEYKFLNLNNVVDIVRLLASNKEINNANCIFVKDGVNYQVLKKDNSIVFKSDNGKYMSVEIDAFDINDISIKNPDYKELCINTTYLLNNKSLLTMCSHPSLDGNFSNLCDIARHNLFEKMTIDYTNSNGELEGSLSVDFKHVRVYGKENINRIYSFTSNRIENNEISTTLDGETLLELDGKELPDNKIIMSFNPLLEKKRINDYFKKEDLHPFMTEFVSYADEYIDNKKKYIDRINNYYTNEKHIVQKAISIRDNVIDSSEKMFTEDELKTCIEKIKEDINKRKDTNDEIEIDSNEQKAVKVKSLKKRV
jgi:hypothetical protein